MPFTYGHAQKAITICAKHQWCHGMYQNDAYPIPPTDAKILSIARDQVRVMGQRPIGIANSWSQADTITEIRDFWRLEEQAAANRMPLAVWELFAFNVSANPSLVEEIPSADEILERQQLFLSSNSRAANPGSLPARIQAMAQRDALRSTFTQGTWPWRPRVPEMTSSQLSLKAECEAVLMDEAWQRSVKYANSAEGMSQVDLEREMTELRLLMQSKFEAIL
jgi:hypothetical protein